MKRTFDLIASLFLLVVLFPVFVLVALTVYIFIGKPLLFSQVRPGLYGKPFLMYKFRTMTNELDVNGKLLPDDKRLNRVGRLIRSTSLDELPEIYNVLKGEMSLVGPRPLLMEYLPLYSEEQARRHDVRPGITGWAQVNGRNSITWIEKFNLDVWYVDHRNFWLDIRILFLTLRKVIIREGISSSSSATMEPFKGESSE